MEAVTKSTTAGFFDEPIKVLLVEDSSDDAELLARAVKKTRFELIRADKLSTALSRIEQLRFDVILLDLTLPDSRGFDTFRSVHDAAPATAIIVLTGLDDQDLGLRTVREGAQDYLVKGHAEGPLLVRAIRYAVERSRADEVTARYARELQAKNDELQDDLALAREIQLAFLPQRYPPFPVEPKPQEGLLRFAHRYLPAGTVGGDFFNVRAVSRDEVGITMCDVMGHGVRAALITAMLRALIDAHATSASDPAKLLGALNDALRAILRDVDSQLFVSAFSLVVSSATGAVRAASAGHPSPLICRASDQSVVALRPMVQGDGPALGLIDGAQYRTIDANLQRGDRVVLFTDGMYEVENKAGEGFGHGRLREAMRDRAGLPLDPFLDELLSMVRHHAAGAPLEDDACVVAMDFATA